MDTRPCRVKPVSAMLLPVALMTAAAAAQATDARTALLAETCSTCHGRDGRSMGPATPVIAGLSRNYIVGAMLAYKYADDLARAQTAIDADPELADVGILQRSSVMMSRIAPAYTVAEIKALATHFSVQKFDPPAQAADADKARIGGDLHERYCAKCHEENGRSTADDVGLLAGQWMPYLRFTLEDFLAGDREMPEKMAKKVKEVRTEKGEEALFDTIHFYAGQR